MTFKDSLHIVTTDFFIKLIVPDKVMCLTEKTRATKKAFEELRVRPDLCPRSLSIYLFPLKALHCGDDPRTSVC